MLFTCACPLAVSVLCLLYFDTYFPTAQRLWMLDISLYHKVVYFPLYSCYHVFTFLFHPSFFPPLQASCVSLINLYHSLVNCLTFTSCIWGACSDKWNGSAVLQGQIPPLGSSTSFISCHPFIWLPFTCSSEVESPSKKKRDTKAKLAGKRIDKKHPSLAKRNRKPPSTCLRKCNQSRLWDEPKMPLLPHILHLWPFGNINPPGVGYKKALTVTRYKGLFTLEKSC